MPRRTMRRRTTRRSRTYARRRSARDRGSDVLSNRYIQGAAYGLIRPKISDATRNIFSKVPIIGDLIGRYGDEVALLGTAYATDKLVKNDRVKSFARKVQFAETARIMEQVDVNSLIGSFGGTSSNTQNSNTNNNGF